MSLLHLHHELDVLDSVAIVVVVLVVAVEVVTIDGFVIDKFLQLSTEIIPLLVNINTNNDNHTNRIFSYLLSS
jgi:hypothetical protein